MSMKKISLITVYNNKKLLDEMLFSVKGQKDVDVDCVMIDNRQKAFGSAAAALNYGADLCLQAGLDPNLRVMVIPMDYVWHKSNGNADRSYHKTQSKLACKYKGKYDIINTTNGFQYTNGFKRFVTNIYRKLRYNI